MTHSCLAELINIDVTDHIKTDWQIQNLKQAIGAATHAAKMGKSDDEIMTMSRWKSDSYKRYIRIDTNLIHLKRVGKITVTWYLVTFSLLKWQKNDPFMLGRTDKYWCNWSYKDRLTNSAAKMGKSDDEILTMGRWKIGFL
jgi:hypothetical protein